MPGSSPDASLETEIADLGLPGEDDENSTESSSGSGAKGASSLLDSVKGALEDKEHTPGSDEQGSKPATIPAEGQKPDATAELEGDPSPAELKQYGPRAQKRIKQLLGQRDEAIGKVSVFEKKASHFDQIDGFARNNRMTPEDIAISLELGALLNANDPERALNRLRPIVERLEKDAGNVLPADLQERVNLGYISEQDARELHRARTGVQRSKEAQHQTEQERLAEQQRARSNEIVSVARDTGVEWESKRKARDPSWHLKQERFNELVELEIRRSGVFPETKQATLDLLNKLADRVDTEYARHNPKPKEVRPVTGGSASHRATSEPKTALEAAKRALAGAS